MDTAESPDMSTSPPEETQMAATPQQVNASPNAAANPNAIAPETLEFFKGDALRARVFHDKYALRDPDGTVLERTPVAM